MLADTLAKCEDAAKGDTIDHGQLRMRCEKMGRALAETRVDHDRAQATIERLQAEFMRSRSMEDSLAQQKLLLREIGALRENS